MTTATLTPTTARNQLARDPRTEVFAYRVVVNGRWYGTISGYPYSEDQQDAALQSAKNLAAGGREADWTWTVDEDGTINGSDR